MKTRFDYKKNVGNVVRERRQKLGKSRLYIANATGIDPSYLRRIEGGPTSFLSSTALAVWVAQSKCD
ncbi:helix-turn-helix domain-containing protein [Evansella sp. LMS18]|uniref:helix-turn-helix domain-containing protein n=1 Tax=Evansella sp. LMS18 TaxID=2924033 RepID=UPI0020D12C1C|nr:helix-turn-helix transcriptional regulator [Evansella sp. LMS18]UTR12086.1 helix-turn-helix domain-containing protein [Evansella sp. LMS18]